MAKLTRTSRRLRKCTTRTSFLRTRGTGQLAPAGPYCTYAVHVPAYPSRFACTLAIINSEL